LNKLSAQLAVAPGVGDRAIRPIARVC